MPAIPGDSPIEAAMRYLQQGQPQPQPQSEGSGNWLEDAINAVHSGMVEEQDAKQISLLGAILNQLTTFQANRVAVPPQGQGG